MKVVCIIKNKHLTLNKVYETTYDGMFTCVVINDNKEEISYLKRIFIELNETRIFKLNKLNKLKL